jgi:hypothetical protein
VYRAVSRGNPLPMFFGMLIGRMSQDVRATATAWTPPGSPPFALDGDAIENGNNGGPGPCVEGASDHASSFTDVQVNDDIAGVGERAVLEYFAENVGGTICLGSGQLGDEGWFAVEEVPYSWIAAGPSGDGGFNWWVAGPGLGGGADPEALLDHVPDVNPYDDTELPGLVGRLICAIVPDGDVSMYSPTEASLMGSTKGKAAFTVDSSPMSHCAPSTIRWPPAAFSSSSSPAGSPDVGWRARRRPRRNTAIPRRSCQPVQRPVGLLQG